MSIQKKQKYTGLFGGAVIGFLNGLFGSGGGMVAVPLLNAYGVQDAKAHATSIGVILPLTAASAAVYLWRGAVTVQDALPYLAGGIPGSFAGAWLLRRLPPAALSRIFGALILFAAARMWFS